eukprot:889173-Alexandrium_andersonii.AAC.1
MSSMKASMNPSLRHSSPGARAGGATNVLATMVAVSGDPESAAAGLRRQVGADVCEVPGPSADGSRQSEAGMCGEVGIKPVAAVVVVAGVAKGDSADLPGQAGAAT